MFSNIGLLSNSVIYKNYVGNNPKLINQEHEFEVSIIKPISVKNKKNRRFINQFLNL